MSYAASEIGGKLITIADYDLERMQIQLHETPPFDSTTGDVISRHDILSPLG